MILQGHHSNVVILADGLKSCVFNVFSYSQAALDEIEQLESSGHTEMPEILKPQIYKAQQYNAELNLILNAAFFLESYINMYDYTLNAADPNYDFESLANAPTSQKWRSHFPTATDFLARMRDLFNFRNFLVHSKPIRRSNGVSEVLVKNQGWIPAKNVSSFVNNEMGLVLGNFKLAQLIAIRDLVDESVDLIANKTNGFNLHYNLKLGSDEQFDQIRDCNEKFDKIARRLAEKIKSK